MNAGGDDEERARQLGEYFLPVRQGDIFDVATGDQAGSRFVVISQTCDVVLPKRPTITVARLVEPTGADLSVAASGDTPRYVALPAAGEGVYADLSYIETLEKAELFQASYTPGLDPADEPGKRKFSLALSRWFARFPFPDEVVPWLRPVERLIREKHNKNSPLGRLLRDVVVEIRFQADQWLAPPFRLEVHIIVSAGLLPTTGDDPSPLTADASAMIFAASGAVRPPGELADAYWTSTNNEERAAILSALGDSFAAVCVPPAEADEATRVAVSDLSGLVWSDDDFPLSRVRKSEPLDIEYLSEQPSPL